MKIKDAVVISESLFDKIVRRLDKLGCQNLSEELESNYKPLEPIIKDAYNAGYDWNQDIEGYLNDKEI